MAFIEGNCGIRCQKYATNVRVVAFKSRQDIAAVVIVEEAVTNYNVDVAPVRVVYDIVKLVNAQSYLGDVASENQRN